MLLHCLCSKNHLKRYIQYLYHYLVFGKRQLSNWIAFQLKLNFFYF